MLTWVVHHPEPPRQRSRVVEVLLACTCELEKAGGIFGYFLGMTSCMTHCTTRGDFGIRALSRAGMHWLSQHLERQTPPGLFAGPSRSNGRQKLGSLANAAAVALSASLQRHPSLNISAVQSQSPNKANRSPPHTAATKPTALVAKQLHPGSQLARHGLYSDPTGLVPM